MGEIANLRVLHRPMAAFNLTKVDVETEGQAVVSRI
jgi:hypothetical protein